MGVAIPIVLVEGERKMEPAKSFTEGERWHLSELTITVRDVVTDTVSTITGIVKDLAIAMPVTEEEFRSFSPDQPMVQVNTLAKDLRSVGLSGEWVLSEGDYYFRVSIQDNFKWPEDPMQPSPDLPQ
jgi:hypothetical protein